MSLSGRERAFLEPLALSMPHCSATLLAILTCLRQACITKFRTVRKSSVRVRKHTLVGAEQGANERNQYMGARQREREVLLTIKK